MLILASVHDTFPKPQASHTLWVGVDDFDTAQAFKREVCLGGGAADLPASVEYMDGSSVRVVDDAGRILCWAIGVVGIGETLKRMWDMKLAFEALPIPLAPTLADRLRYPFNGLCPRNIFFPGGDGAKQAAGKAMLERLGISTFAADMAKERKKAAAKKVSLAPRIGVGVQPPQASPCTRCNRARPAASACAAWARFRDADFTCSR